MSHRPLDSGFDPAWIDALHQKGFRFGPAGYQLNGYTCRFDGHWISLTTGGEASFADPLRDGFEQPGLWTWHGAEPVRVFEFPVSLLADSANGTEAASFDALLRWALGTAEGRLTEGWSVPVCEEVNQWLPPESLAIQAGGLLRQATWVRSDNRLILQVVLAELPSGANETRRRLMEALLLEAQRCWRMVRFGLLTEASITRAVARIDFTGAPDCEGLVLIGHAALNGATRWLLESAEVLADCSVVSKLLEACPVEKTKRPEERKL